MTSEEYQEYTDNVMLCKDYVDKMVDQINPIIESFINDEEAQKILGAGNQMLIIRRTLSYFDMGLDKWIHQRIKDHIKVLAGLEGKTTKEKLEFLMRREDEQENQENTEESSTTES